MEIREQKLFQNKEYILSNEDLQEKLNINEDIEMLIFENQKLVIRTKWVENTSRGGRE